MTADTAAHPGELTPGPAWEVLVLPVCAGFVNIARFTFSGRRRGLRGEGAVLVDLQGLREGRASTALRAGPPWVELPFPTTSSRPASPPVCAFALGLRNLRRPDAEVAPNPGAFCALRDRVRPSAPSVLPWQQAAQPQIVREGAQLKLPMASE